MLQIRRPGALLLLLPMNEGKTVRISPDGELLLPLLTAGSTREQLLSKVQSLGKDAGDGDARLSTFLGQLAYSGMLEGGALPAAAPESLSLSPLDPVARAIGRSLIKAPTWVVGMLAVGVLATALVGVTRISFVPRVGDLLWRFDLIGLLAYLLVIPMHELGHMVAAHAAGVPVSRAGMRLGRLGRARWSVHTTLAYTIPSRMPRFWIAAAGPLVSLLAAGTAAWINGIVAPGSMVGHAAAYTFLLCVWSVFVNTSLLFASDGSHMVEALLDDELARKAALCNASSRMTSRRTIRLYRLACAAHLALVGLVVWRWR